MSSGAARVASGRRLVNRGRHAAAQKTLLRALNDELDADDRAMAHAALAFIESEFANPERASAHMRLAASVPGISPGVRANLLGQEAILRSRAGELGEPLALFARAIDALPPTSPERATFQLDSGLIRLELGQFDAATAAFEAAARAFARLGDDVGWGQAVHNLGYAQMCRGDLAAALQNINAAGVVLDEISPTVRAVNLQDRAEVLMRAGRASEAVPMLDEAAKVFGRHRLPRPQGECELVASRAVLHTDPVRSRRLARQAARHFRAHGSEPYALRAESVAMIAEANIRPTRAWLPRADALSEQLRDDLLAHDAQLLDLHAALVAVRRGGPDVARVLLHRGRTTTRDSLTERLLERRVKAALAASAGRRRSALQHLRAGLDLLHDWQATFSSLDLMSSVVGHGRELATTGIQLALEIGEPGLVFEWSERARALTTRVVPVRPPKDEQAAADLVEIRTLTVTEPAPGTRGARRLAELRESVRQRAWLGAGSGEVNRIAGLDEVIAALGPDTALVSYLWNGRDRVHALVVTDESRQIIDLGASDPLTRLLGGLRADLDVSASEWGEAMERVVRAGRDRRLAEVAEVLVAPLLPAIGDRRCVITQAGILAGVPWSMLPGLVGRPLTIAPTATSWLAARDLPAPVGVGFVAGPDVPRAVEEVKQSASRWPSTTVLVDGDATTERVVELAGRVDVLHISAHGKHATENPLFSGVLLDDGPLFGYDLDQLSEVPGVVILSACEVGRSTQRWAEESLGMVNAWLHAGARCVIASAAAVADDEACEVLQDVHRLMAAGAPPGVALAEATADRPTSFVCFGAGW